MAWSLKAHAVANGAGSATATTGAIDTTGADLLIIGISRYFGASGVSLTDSKSNTWHALTVHSASSDVSNLLYYAWNPTVGSGHTFSFSGSAIYVTLCVAAFSGSQTSSDPFDAQNGGNTASGSTLQPGSVGTNGELVVTSWGKGGGSGTDTINLSFSISDQAAYSNGNWYGGDLAWLAATGAVNPTWTLGSGTADLAASVASFKAASGVSRGLRFNPNLDGLSAAGSFFADRLAAA